MLSDGVVPNFEGLAWAQAFDMTTDVPKKQRRTGMRLDKFSGNASNMLEGMRDAFMKKVRESMSGKKITMEIVQKALQLSDEAKSILKNCANWSFNVF